MVGKYFVGYSTTGVKNPGSVRFYDIDIVKRDLMNHFMTRRGERLMQPNYGCIVWDLLFEPYEGSTRDRIVNDCKRIINADARVKLVDMTINEYEHGLGVAFLLDFEPDGVRDSLFLAFRKSLTNDSNNTIIEDEGNI